jgi:hypothetical protein
MAKQTPKKTVKRVSNDPVINHIKRGVTYVKRAIGAMSIGVPGLGGARLLNKATKALKKVNRGY